MRRPDIAAVLCATALFCSLFLTPVHAAFNSSSSSSSSSSPSSSSSFAYNASSTSSFSSSSSSYGSSSSASSSSTGLAVSALGGASTGLIVYGSICFLGVIFFTSYLLNLYARPGCPPVALFLTWLSWLITFSICFLVPIDLLPGVSTSLDTVWATLYWSQFLLMWLIIPFASGYYDNGGFTFKQRCLASLRFNAILALVVAVIAGAGAVYLVAAAKWSASDISGTAVCASTVWGLIMLVVSGGWGLVEIPRGLREYRSTERRRNRIHFDAASIHHEAEEARDELVATINFLRLLEPRLYAKVQGAKVVEEEKQLPGIDDRRRKKPRDIDEEEEGDQHSHGDENTELAPSDAASRPSLHALHFAYFKQILALVKDWEVELAALTAHPHPFDLPFKQSLMAASLTTQSLSLAQLTALHYHVITATKKLTLIETQWRDTVDASLRLEKDIADQGNTHQASWYLRTGRSKSIQAAYVGAVVLSVVILFCELTVPAGAAVSPLGWLVTWTKGFFLSEQIFTAVPLVYLSICAYHPLFRLRLGNLYYLGRHRSDEGTLLLNATLLLRISVPLAYNFTLLLHQDAGSLTQFIGTVNVIPFFGTQFNTIFPIFMVAIALLVLSRIISYILVCLNVKSLKFDLVRHSADDPEIADLMEEGRTLIGNEMRKRAKEGKTAAAQPAERTVVDGLAERVKVKLADRERRRDKESAEVRERIVELGSGRSGERRHRSEELAGAMGEGVDTEQWRHENQAEHASTTNDAYYNDPAASAIRMGLVVEGEAQSDYYGGDDQQGEERVYDEDGYDQDGLDVNGYDRWGGYWSVSPSCMPLRTLHPAFAVLTSACRTVLLSLSGMRMASTLKGRRSSERPCHSRCASAIQPHADQLRSLCISRSDGLQSQRTERQLRARLTLVACPLRYEQRVLTCASDLLLDHCTGACLMQLQCLAHGRAQVEHAVSLTDRAQRHQVGLQALLVLVERPPLQHPLLRWLGERAGGQQLLLLLLLFPRWRLSGALVGQLPRVALRPLLPDVLQALVRALLQMDCQFGGRCGEEEGGTAEGREELRVR